MTAMSEAAHPEVPSGTPGGTAGAPTSAGGGIDRSGPDPDDELTRHDVLAAAIETELESSPAGESVEKAKRHIVLRVGSVVLGFVVLCLGIAMLALPGPGLLVVAIGLGLLATEIPFARRLLDNVRERLPQDADGKLPKSTIVTMVVCCTLGIAASLWWSFLR